MNTQHTPVNAVYKLRELLDRVKIIRCDHSVSYSAIVQWRSNDLERQIKRIIADEVAHEIAGEVMRVGTWSKTRGPDGEVFSVRGIWMDYDSLYRLVEDAYSIGRNPLYTAPQKREWIGLTDEEMKNTWYEMQNIMGWYSFQEISKAIEAKLKEKNTWLRK